MKYLLPIIILSVSCSHQSPKVDRYVANAESCAELAEQIKDEETLKSLGCTLDGKQSNISTESSEWNTGGTFNEVETGGIIMDAVQKAHRSCLKTSRLCVIKNINLKKAQNESDGRRHTEYTVVMHGVDSYIMNSQLQQFDATDSNYSSSQSSQLLLLSAQYGAMSEALEKCYTAGFPLCALGGYNLTESNNYRDGKYWVTAKATVIGVDFLGKPRSTRVLKSMSKKSSSHFSLDSGVPVPNTDFQAD